MSSGDQIRYFFEADAEKQGYNMDTSLNKIGHALHDYNQTFEAFSYSQVMKDIAAKIFGYQAPIVV